MKRQFPRPTWDELRERVRQIEEEKQAKIKDLRYRLDEIDDEIRELESEQDELRDELKELGYTEEAIAA